MKQTTSTNLNVKLLKSFIFQLNVNTRTCMKLTRQITLAPFRLLEGNQKSTTW